MTKTEAMIDVRQAKEKLWIKATAPLFFGWSLSRISNSMKSVVLVNTR